ncbi:Regulator Of G-Protein Signaling 14 [Manis pentadactyla]|nr:Regulator Of G-Protein Signaling 14 [Manis pentadactyla]
MKGPGERGRAGERPSAPAARASATPPKRGRRGGSRERAGARRLRPGRRETAASPLPSALRGLLASAAPRLPRLPAVWAGELPPCGGEERGQAGRPQGGLRRGEAGTRPGDEPRRAARALTRVGAATLGCKTSKPAETPWPGARAGRSAQVGLRSPRGSRREYPARRKMGTGALGLRPRLLPQSLQRARRPTRALRSYPLLGNRNSGSERCGVLGGGSLSAGCGRGTGGEARALGIPDPAAGSGQGQPFRQKPSRVAGPAAAFPRLRHPPLAVSNANHYYVRNTAGRLAGRSACFWNLASTDGGSRLAAARPRAVNATRPSAALPARPPAGTW